MALEDDPSLRGRLTLLPVELKNKLLKTCKVIEDAADERFRSEDPERTRNFVTSYLRSVVATICDWNENPKLKSFPFSVQPYTSSPWLLITELLIDQQGSPIDDPEKIDGLIDSICYVPTVLSSDIFMRVSHLRNTKEGIFKMALVHRDYILANASPACISNLPQIEQ